LGHEEEAFRRSGQKKEVGGPGRPHLHYIKEGKRGKEGRRAGMARGIEHYIRRSAKEQAPVFLLVT
jgi:hypothetical protein